MKLQKYFGKFLLYFFLMVLFITAGCSGGGGGSSSSSSSNSSSSGSSSSSSTSSSTSSDTSSTSSGNSNSTSAGQWTWMHGSNATDPIGAEGIRGYKGIADSNNVPSGRHNAVAWTDKNGNLWVYGGYGYDWNGDKGYLEDLWKFDGTYWTFVSGTEDSDLNGSYGTKGIAASGNSPGGRESAVSWIDSSGNLWLFGGNLQNIRNGSFANRDLNDLWKFDGTYWTWISGSDSNLTQSGNYGTKGIAAHGNTPGGRSGAVSWTDKNDNLWLFGGTGADENGAYGDLNDLWKFDGTYWTWISGSNTIGQIPSYGTKGIAAASNVPSARRGAVSWTDSSGNLWLFGGTGYYYSGAAYVNDLWKFDGTYWTWISGSNTGDPIGSYGTKGIAALGNTPGGRIGAVSWIDSSGNLWLFGGTGVDTNGDYGDLNDLWKFDGTYWTWISGSNTTDPIGSYGTKGIAAVSNVPSARSGAVSSIDKKGNLWLFSGGGYHNDLWKYQP